MPKSYDDVVEEAKGRITEIEPAELQAALESGDEIAIIDVRDHHDWLAERIPGSIPIERGKLESRIAKELDSHEQRIVVHCGGGGRGPLAADTLQAMGYAHVQCLKGGLRAWKAAGHPTATSEPAD